MGKLLLSAMVILMAGFLIFGCAQQAQPAPAPAAPAQNAAASPATAPVKNITPPAPEFKPIHLSYLIANSGPQGQPQDVNMDYYLDQKATCGGRPALNGYMKAVQQGQQGAAYMKVTVYLDTGEAAYSGRIGEADLAFDTAKPAMADFDVAFYLQTIAARGGKNLLSAEMWNATGPVLLKNIAVFGGVGDYSVSQYGTGSSGGKPCENFTAAIKASSMEGQISVCVQKLDDIALSYSAMGGFPGESNGPSWQLTALSREKSPLAYYPQCLAPVACPSVNRATPDDYSQCGSQGKTLRVEHDASGCVTAFNCITYEEDAQKEIAGMQRPGCPVDNAMVTKIADCRKQQGNVNYQQNQQSGCLESVDCAMPPQGNNQPQQPPQ